MERALSVQIIDTSLVSLGCCGQCW